MNETAVMATVDSFVAKGFPSYGYEYINLDDCFVEVERGDDGKLQSDQKTFKSGMRVLSDYVHDAGLLFGVYTDRGNETCGGRQGAEGFEEIDADTYVNDWNIDYLKEDSCFASTDHDIAFEQYGKMRDGLNKTGKAIFFSLCGWEDWYAPEGAGLGNSWRTGPDDSNWGGVMTNVDIMADGESTLGDLAAFSGPDKGWNDPCLLLSVDASGKRDVTELQTRTQFNLWSILASPLLISGSIINMSDADMETYQNQDVINVNQDPLGKQGVRLIGENLNDGSVSLYARPLANTDVAFTVVNSKSTDETFTCDESCLNKLGVNDESARVMDLWSGEEADYSGMSLVLDLEKEGGSRMFRVSGL